MKEIYNIDKDLNTVPKFESIVEIWQHEGPTLRLSKEHYRLAKSASGILSASCQDEELYEKEGGLSEYRMDGDSVYESCLVMLRCGTVVLASQSEVLAMMQNRGMNTEGVFSK